MHLAAWRWAPAAAWIFMLPVAVLTVGFSLALGSALSLALEPFADRAGTAAAVYGLFQMSGSAVIATALLDQGVAPQAAMGLIGVVIVGPLPVSYTHLDVYKRQREISAPCSALRGLTTSRSPPSTR